MGDKAAAAFRLGRLALALRLGTTWTTIWLCVCETSASYSSLMLIS
jgi:hypothetical protein